MTKNYVTYNARGIIVVAHEWDWVGVTQTSFIHYAMDEEQAIAIANFLNDAHNA